jgi:hypothetical protein
MASMLHRRLRQEVDDRVKPLWPLQHPRHAIAVVDMSVLTRDVRIVSKRRDTECKNRSIDYTFSTAYDPHTKQQQHTKT